jgi:hypothetical protein
MPEGGKKTIQVFSRGLLVTLDYAFWMLPFSSNKQANKIQQENGILEDNLQTRSDILSAEHKHPDARSYLESGWQVLILPWVVGVRGMVHAKSVLEILDFLRVSRQRRTKIVEDVTLESAKALYYYHQIRYQAFKLNRSENQLQQSGIKQNDSTGSVWHLRQGRPHDSMQQQAAEY